MEKTKARRLRASLLLLEVDKVVVEEDAPLTIPRASPATNSPPEKARLQVITELPHFLYRHLEKIRQSLNQDWKSMEATFELRLNS